jgi:hypothetical protein
MGDFNVIEMERMLLVGLVCVHPDYEKRPRVRDAVRMIKKFKRFIDHFHCCQQLNQEIYRLLRLVLGVKLIAVM